MCKTDPFQFESLVRRSIGAIGLDPVIDTIEALPPAAAGSRRRRIWDLDGQAHCPVVGVCLPIAVLRRLVDKALGGQTLADDYEVHCGAVADCKRRSPIAEAVQRELDRRYALPLRHATRLKTTEALAAWWALALRSHDVAGALWATLTHPRCTPELAHRVEGQVHMLQHQLGMATRADHDRLETVSGHNAELQQELAELRRRVRRQAEDHARGIEALQRTVMELRARAVVHSTLIDAQHAEMRTLEAAAPDLKSRLALAGELEAANRARLDQQRTVSQLQHEAERQGRRIGELQQALDRSNRADAGGADRMDRLHPPNPARDVSAAEAHLPAETAAAGEAATRLDARAVLCVGGRTASVPIYRQLIEDTGGRFLHHDGGEQDGTAKLDATLAAADLVICQTGCISHDAYWRVKDHCKRTGKRCVFVESPSGAGLKRALMTLVPAG